MMPKVIIHNQVSLDGRIDGFEPDMGTYYQLAAGFEPDAMLVGSHTVDSAHDDIPSEENFDFLEPVIEPGDVRPYWVVPDSRGVLLGKLHYYRRMPYIKDIIVLVSARTPAAYLSYLEERHYDTIVVGGDHVDYQKALEVLEEMYAVRTVVVDGGGTLCSILLHQGLVDEISLMVSPALVGSAHPDLFRGLDLSPAGHRLELELLKSEVLENRCIHLHYRILGNLQ